MTRHGDLHLGNIASADAQERVVFWTDTEETAGVRDLVWRELVPTAETASQVVSYERIFRSLHGG